MEFATQKINEALGTATLFVYPPRKWEERMGKSPMYAKLVTLDKAAQIIIADIMEKNFGVERGSQGQLLDSRGKPVPDAWQYTSWIESPETLDRFREQYGQHVKIIEVPVLPYEKTKTLGEVKFQAPRPGFKGFVTEMSEESVLDVAVRAAIANEMEKQAVSQKSRARSKC